MTSPDSHLDDKPSVTVRCQDNSSVSVAFCDRFSFDQDSVHYAVEARAPGLIARVNEVVAWICDNDLTTFLDALAADYWGWAGERTWHTMDRDLAVSAVFRSGGYIGLTWTIRPWRSVAGDWSTSVTTWLEAGEQMSSFASDIRHFLAVEHVAHPPMDVPPPGR
ncbi:DUF6228 family protein [Streptomyces sp. CC228A]|uniref:DUF6228 family protein n=1 Tax=Streptomyces sp. CC228A TaxID=2898186 RepID=UPI001F21BB7C|nr:DUF6228 family protein [Streptomyces sp. CC228A]